MADYRQAVHQSEMDEVPNRVKTYLLVQYFLERFRTIDDYPIVPTNT